MVRGGVPGRRPEALERQGSATAGGACAAARGAGRQGGGQSAECGIWTHVKRTLKEEQVISESKTEAGEQDT